MILYHFVKCAFSDLREKIDAAYFYTVKIQI